MKPTLLRGLTEKDMGAVIHTYNLNDFYYPTLFPLKETPFLTWKTLEAQTGAKIAADAVARGATIPRKNRPAIDRIQGDIPKFAISREKKEDELTEYDILLNYAGSDADQKAIIEFWAEDTEFCWNGIAARAEWVALKCISLGKVKFSTSNNAALVQEYDCDYQIPTAQKLGVNTPYDNTTDAKPLSVDIPRVLELGRSLYGVKYQFAFMNYTTFNKFANQTEVWKYCASYFQNATGTQDTPTVDSVNAYLKKQDALYRGLQIVIIDSDVTLELADGSQVTENPFEDDVILFSESKQLGRTYWKKPIDAGKLAGSDALKVMHGHTLIKKFSNEEPIEEVTQGIANLFPGWNLAGRSVLMQTSATSWTKN